MFLVHNASFDLIVTHFDITGNREAFAEGVANEAVVGKDVAQVGMIFEDNAVPACVISTAASQAEGYRPQRTNAHIVEHSIPTGDYEPFNSECILLPFQCSFFSIHTQSLRRARR